MISSSESLTRFFKTVSPAVVALEVKTSKNGSYSGLDWRDRHQFGGTAFFIDADGSALTAASLVKDAGRIVLTAATGRSFRAGVVGISSSGGVALLRTVGRLEKPVSFLSLGRSAGVKVGDRAFTLGNPFGTIKRTGQVAASRGSVSGIYQVNGAGAYKGEVLETDAAVNPGAFGGPLLNDKGQVVGILLEAFSFQRWLGAALPIDQVKAILPALRKRKDLEPGAIGFQSVARVIERYRGRVIHVDPDSPAAGAGLRRGDEIVEFGGAPIDDYEAFLDALHSLPAHSMVNLRVIRPPTGPTRGQPDTMHRITFKVGPAELPAPVEPHGTLGLRFSDRKSSTRMEVVWVDPKGPAREAGILTGDILTRIEGRRANRKLTEAVLKSKREGERVKLRFSRDGWIKSFNLVLAPTQGK